MKPQIMTLPTAQTCCFERHHLLNHSLKPTPPSDVISEWILMCYKEMSIVPFCQKLLTQKHCNESSNALPIQARNKLGTPKSRANDVYMFNLQTTVKSSHHNNLQRSRYRQNTALDLIWNSPQLPSQGGRGREKEEGDNWFGSNAKVSCRQNGHREM